MTLENLFNLHYVFNDQKIAVNFHLEKLCKPFTNQPSEMQKLPGKILRQQGWEVLDLSEQDFNSWNQEEKVTNVKGWLKEAKARQIKKGVTQDWKAPI